MAEANTQSRHLPASLLENKMESRAFPAHKAIAGLHQARESYISQGKFRLTAILLGKRTFFSQKSIATWAK
jgi:hypothetical protein